MALITTPLVERRGIIKIGNSHYISLPPQWVKTNVPETTTDLLMIASNDIRIVNPSDENKVYKEVRKIVRKAKTK